MSVTQLCYRGKQFVAIDDMDHPASTYLVWGYIAEDGADRATWYKRDQIKVGTARKVRAKKLKGQLTPENEYKMANEQRAYVSDAINDAYGREVFTVKHGSRTLTGAKLEKKQDQARQFLLNNPGFFSKPGDGSLVDDLVSSMGKTAIELPWQMWRWSSHDLDAMAICIARQQERAAERERLALEAAKAAELAKAAAA